MKMLYDDKGNEFAIVFDKKEAKALIEIIAAALKSDKALNKRSAAYKIAMQIDNELPVF